MNWRRILEIARWEYLQKVRSKGFISSLILTPVFIVGFAVIPSLLIDQDPESTELIGLIDSTRSLYLPLQEHLDTEHRIENGQPAYKLFTFDPDLSVDSAIAQADRDILAERINGVAVIRDSAGVMTLTFRTLNPGNIRILSDFENAVETIITRRRLESAGIDSAVYASASAPIELNAIKVTESGEVDTMGVLQTFFSAYIGVILFMILIMTTGQTLVRSLVEEKSNRIMELLVSSGTADELMWGKLLGLSALGITQVLCWGLLGIAAISYTGLPISDDALAPIPFILMYIGLGYLLYSAFFIGFGSLVTTEQEAQVVTQYLTMFLVAPLAFAFVVMQNPDAGYVQGLSYMPLLTPALMIIRLVTKMPPLWEIIATAAVLLATTTVVMWIASRVFRTAILMYGKRPSVREIVRWVRM